MSSIEAGHAQLLARFYQKHAALELDRAARMALVQREMQQLEARQDAERILWMLLAVVQQLLRFDHLKYLRSEHPADNRTAIQDWLGHRSIQHTVRYTELAPTRFKHFWR
jgi:hypothetical protein